MRLIGRNKPDEPTGKAADFVLQLGNSKIPLPAEKLAGAASRSDDDILRHLDSSEPNTDEQDKALDALMRMRQTLTSPSGTAVSGQWSHWSPDDFYTAARQNASDSSGTLLAPDLPEGWDRRPSNFAPEAYDPDSEPAHFCPAVPNPIAKDIPPPNNQPNIFDGLGEMPRRRTSPEPPSSRNGAGHKKSRRPHLGQLFPPRSTSTANQSRHERVRSGNDPTGSTRRVHDFGDDVVQATKTNVRRPPKGIQNWFDGFISSDDDEDDDDEDDEAELQQQQQLQQQQLLAARQQAPLPPLPMQMEPQELPAEEIAPPAYSGPMRGGSIASHRSNRSYTPGDDAPPPFQHLDEKIPIERTESVSTHTGSLHSSHSQRRPHGSDGRLSRSKLASESVLALSDQSTSDTEEGSRGAATRINTRPLRSAPDVAGLRTRSTEAITSAPRESLAHSISSDPIPSMQHRTRADLRAANPLDPTTVALRRLNGYSMADSRGSSTSAATSFIMDSGSVLATDSISNVPMDASHMMVVTDEERMLLDMMRRKRSVMQQVSFTEGYQLALQREQSSPMRRSASVDSTAQQIIDQRETQTDMTSHEIMRKKLSILQKQDVDEALKMARFLGMQSSSEEDVSWPRDSMMPTELPSSRPQNDQQAADGYSPAHRTRDSASSIYSTRPEEYSLDTQATVRKYLSSNTLPSPSTAAKLFRQISVRNGITPSPVPEEESTPEVPERNPERGRRHESQPARRVSRSVDAAPLMSNAALAYRSATFDSASGFGASPTTTAFSPNTNSPLSSIITAASRGDRQRRPTGNESPDTEVSQHSLSGPKTLPKGIPSHVRARESGTTQRSSMTSSSSAGEDVLAAWADLGGGSDCLQTKRRTGTAASQQ